MSDRRDQANTFLSWLGGKHFFVTKKDTGEYQKTAHYPGASLDFLNKENKQRRGVYVVINEHKLDTPKNKAMYPARGNQYVTAVRALFIDADEREGNIEVLAKAKLFGLPPSCVVESSKGKYHIYWKVKDFPVEMFRSAQKALAAHFGTDEKVCDLARVLRVPGFYHHKKDPALTRIVELNDNVYTLRDFKKHLTIEKEKEPELQESVQDAIFEPQDDFIDDAVAYLEGMDSTGSAHGDNQKLMSYMWNIGHDIRTNLARTFFIHNYRRMKSEEKSRPSKANEKRQLDFIDWLTQNPPGIGKTADKYLTDALSVDSGILIDFFNKEEIDS